MAISSQKHTERNKNTTSKLGRATPNTTPNTTAEREGYKVVGVGSRVDKLQKRCGPGEGNVSSHLLQEGPGPTNGRTSVAASSCETFKGVQNGIRRKRVNPHESEDVEGK